MWRVVFYFDMLADYKRGLITACRTLHNYVRTLRPQSASCHQIIPRNLVKI